jgi:hypothetical protein
MSLRFAIIRHVKTYVGKQWEDITFEYDEEQVFADLLENFTNALPKKKWYQKMNDAEAMVALGVAWEKSMEDFKKITVRIL